MVEVGAEVGADVGADVGLALPRLMLSTVQREMQETSPFQP